jgi:hypothetical protein
MTGVGVIVGVGVAIGVAGRGVEVGRGVLVEITFGDEGVVSASIVNSTVGVARRPQPSNIDPTRSQGINLLTKKLLLAVKRNYTRFAPRYEKVRTHYTVTRQDLRYPQEF